jgi:hypothetical protein
MAQNIRMVSLYLYIFIYFASFNHAVSLLLVTKLPHINCDASLALKRRISLSHPRGHRRVQRERHQWSVTQLFASDGDKFEKVDSSKISKRQQYSVDELFSVDELLESDSDKLGNSNSKIPNSILKGTIEGKELFPNTISGQLSDSNSEDFGNPEKRKSSSKLKRMIKRKVKREGQQSSVDELFESDSDTFENADSTISNSMLQEMILLKELFPDTSLTQQEVDSIISAELTELTKSELTQFLILSVRFSQRNKSIEIVRRHLALIEYCVSEFRTSSWTGRDVASIMNSMQVVQDSDIGASELLILMTKITKDSLKEIIRDNTEIEKKPTPQEISMIMNGLQKMSSDNVQVRLLLLALTPKIDSCKETFSSQAVATSLYGMNTMSSDSTEVRAMLKALVPKVRIHMYIHINVYIWIHRYVYTYTRIYMYVYTYIHIYIYIYILVYIYIYTYRYIYFYL